MDTEDGQTAVRGGTGLKKVKVLLKNMCAEPIDTDSNGVMARGKRACGVGEAGK